MNDKIIVTHLNPDLDAISSVWLLKKFAADFKEAKVCFVPAGQTYQNLKVDENENIVHVDTGMGKFDHHQLRTKTCAAELVFNYLKSKFSYLKKDKALIHLIKVIRDIDNFNDCLWPEPTADYFYFCLDKILDGLKMAGKIDDQGLVKTGCFLLDGVYQSLKIRFKAQEDLEGGYQFSSLWGRAIGVLSSNNKVLKLGLKMGYVLVVQKDGDTEQIRIKARPDSQVDLTKTKERLVKLDPKATWFLHQNKKILLNGSSKNPKMKPSRLSLKKVIEILSS